MQSGISASTELQQAFNKFVSDPSQRALLAGIEKESLVPSKTIPSSNANFTADLTHLQPLLTPTQATYILLKTHPDASDGYTAITYIPNAAPVRQKMLFASTRLTLVRELGIERFRQTLFVTEKDELTVEGWKRHEAHEALAAPLTEEESGLKDVKDAEAEESRGTTGRRGHVPGKVDVQTNEGVVEAIGLLKEEGCKGTLVQLKMELPGEVLTLEATEDGVEARDVTSRIHASEPRYAFYSHPAAAAGTVEILFIYTCPTSSKIKERMIYSTGKSWTRIVAERDAGITISKSLEATEPDELTADLVGAVRSDKVAVGSLGDDVAQESSKPPGSGFARPKRPGRR